MTSDGTDTLTCIDSKCRFSGRATTSTACASCGRPTYSIEGSPKATRSGPGKVVVGLEIGSRVFYGGFWALVAVVTMIGGFSIIGSNAGPGLLGLLIAALSGMYAVYIFRGGRWRIMFW